MGPSLSHYLEAAYQIGHAPFDPQVREGGEGGLHLESKCSVCVSWCIWRCMCVYCVCVCVCVCVCGCGGGRGMSSLSTGPEEIRAHI